MARCHRIGQTKPVTVYRLVSQDSVEEQALSRLAKKLYLSVKVTTAATTGTMTDDKAPMFSKGELIKLLRGGTTALGSPIGEDWNTKPIEEILRESRERQKKREEMLVMTDEEVESMEAELLKDQERIRTNIFEGKVFYRTNKEITSGTSRLSNKVDVRVARTCETSSYRTNCDDRRIRHKQRKSRLWRVGSISYFLSNLCPARKNQKAGNRTSRVVSMLSRRWRFS
jgi:hypothetical protein